MSDTWTPLLSFTGDDRQFALGFEAGRIWTLARSTDEEFTEVAHPENAELILRISEATGRSVRSTDLSDDWIEVTFSEPSGEHG